MIVKEAVLYLRFIIIYLSVDVVSVAAVVVVVAKECLRKHLCVVVVKRES